MRIFSFLSLFALFYIKPVNSSANSTCSNIEPSPNNCVSFSVSSGTGCAWMCNYCATQLGTNNYYFVDDICVYQSGGCVGSPQVGKQYTCCSV
jgi:hypothetical protein